MPSRPILAGLLLLSAAPLCAQRPPFEQRVVAILDAGGSVDTIQGRLSRVGADRSLTHDQRVAVDAVRILIRSRSKPSGLSLAEAEAFAALNPGSPASAMVTAEAALANDEPQRSADTLVAAIARAGPMVQLISPVTISRLGAELDKLGDKERTSDLGKALLEAGWSRGSASLRSYLALAAIRRELGAGRIEEARRLLRSVRSPVTFHEILIDNRLAPLRADVERIAGMRLEGAWRAYLTGARDEWLGRGDLISAAAYADALKQANLYEILADAFILRFSRGYNCPTDQVARALADDLVDSLARIGRWTRAEDVMRRSGGVSPPVYAAMLIERGEFGRAASLLDRSIKAADPPKSDEEHSAIAWLRAARSCAAYRDAGGQSLAFDPGLLDLSARLFALLCLERTADARAVLLAALNGEQERADALRWVQPFLDPPIRSEFRKLMNDKVRSLQRDPAVVAAASSFGSILEWPLSASVPAAAQLATGTPPPWRCGDQFDWEVTAPQTDPRDNQSK